MNLDLAVAAELFDQRLTRVLGLPESVVPVACIAIGHPAKKARARTRHDQRYVHDETW